MYCIKFCWRLFREYNEKKLSSWDEEHQNDHLITKIFSENMHQHYSQYPLTYHEVQHFHLFSCARDMEIKSYGKQRKTMHCELGKVLLQGLKYTSPKNSHWERHPVNNECLKCVSLPFLPGNTMSSANAIYFILLYFYILFLSFYINFT